jgi:oligopeptide transport system substrate-binding protein
MKWILVTLLILIGCGKEPPPAGRLRISFNTQPSTTDPRKAADFVSSTFVCLIYDGLTRCLADGNVELSMAKKVEISKDQKIYIFHLRDACWTNGEPVTAFDFEKSWKEVLSTPCGCSFLFYPIKNAEACVKGLAKVEEVGIIALDKKTLKVELERPTPYFYSLTAFPSFFPTPSNTKADSTVCNGPFRIEKMVHNSEIILKKNPTFWNKIDISADEIHISIVPDEITALQMFERGDLDWLGASISPLPLDAMDKLKERIQSIPCSASTLCTFNTEVFPFNNLNLRKAFSYAIDRDEIVGKVTQGGHISANSILPPSFTLQNLSLFDPFGARIYFEKAMEELQIDPKELETITLYFKPSQIDKRLAQALQRQWQDVFGITIQLTQLDFKSHAQRLQSRDYQISLASWIAQFDDPISILERFKDKANLKNYPGWENLNYRSLLDRASESKARIKLLEEAESLLADQLPLTPIYHWTSSVICSPRIQSIPTTPSGGILFERFKFCKE